MAGYNCLPMKMKRKEIDRVNNDFSDFSLSSPARKIRRLDLDLPPIMEEDEIKSVPVNEERAIVLYKPLQQYHQPSNEQLFVDRDFISGFKNRFLHDAVVADDLCADDDDEKNKQQAVVRWDQSQFQSFEPEITELDGEDAMMEEAAMDVEEPSLPQQQKPGGLLQWQQQQLHCMVPQLPQTNSTPISWYR
ncbi:hypothetical protein ISN45_Aa03g030580 [Arabidopsis thaliana x Arabidopsis arenosa]|uniref:Uncharacterized protein n=1 Tax=Arabidopsis thaliana x Arabidopsis arenosa TaxID=1240361 RepID=A0A8T2AXQ3_9BRAS|nr:hypothetical protein ISN45_Aa03g030580 [Arabidopsis thaliana x Arabidopsis arenosa]